ncbi:hypothetical protein AXG93_961s1020 [Marchantia polymorpha subsp. ruderalis]|uniref:Uncharacterized protein n=1 Tax=Marchantia polymorpha subsp. ruderalis TaxID=1480154 RepID=A0A176VR99_MARPO|nr:hypothetical protein AXG93_961s1020 [Marchantia polymorpha subsp. ruderalis]
MHSMAYGRSGDHRPSRGSRNSAAVAKSRAGPGNNARDFVVPDLPPSSTKPSSPRDAKHRRQYGDGGGGGGRNCNDGDRDRDRDVESVGSSPTPPPELAVRARSPTQRSPRRSHAHRGHQNHNYHDDHDRDIDYDDEVNSSPTHKLRRSPRARSSSNCGPALDLLNNNSSNGDGCRVTTTTTTEARSGRSSPTGRRRKSPTAPAPVKTSTADRQPDRDDSTNGSKSQRKSEGVPDDEGDGGGCGSRRAEKFVDVPYPAKWRCFGRRPPAMLEYRPMGDMRTRNVRPAGKQSYLMRRADERRGCDSRVFEGDLWDDSYGLAKPVTDRWTTPLEYGSTRVIRTGDIDPWFGPARGDLIIINPAQNYYRAMKSGYVMSLRSRYMFGVGDLVLRLGKFMPDGQYVPYGNLELYMHTASRDWMFLGRQPYLLVDFNYHNLDYESPGKYLAIGTFLTDNFWPRRGDIIVRAGAWAENYTEKHRRYHSSVKYWRPNMEFLPNDMLLRPYVDLGRCERTREFYWGAAELYSYSGKGLSWAYWGRDHHVCDTPFPGPDREPIKTGHHKGETGHYGGGMGSGNFMTKLLMLALPPAAWIFLVGMRLVGIKQYYIRDQVRSSKPAGPLVSTKADKWLYTAPCKIHGTVYRILLHMHLKLRQDSFVGSAQVV